MIIQFSHNGPQLNLSKRSPKNGLAYKFDKHFTNTGIRYWNNEELHKRKFIKHSGWYLENKYGTFSTTPKKSELYFWGEWEPQSKFELTGNPYKNKILPHAIHFPAFSTRGIGSHNTDPFVFGKHFFYTNCKQARNKKLMLNLGKDSIILFGSVLNNRFVLDTVFVVDTSERVSDYKKHPQSYPLLLRQSTVDLKGVLDDWHKLYKGKMYEFNNSYSTGNENVFSFVPCKIHCGNKGFSRPIIDIKKFKLQNPIPSFNQILYQVTNYNNIDFWHDLVEEIIRQGFLLGIKLEMPINNDYLDFPEYENHNSKCNKRC